jgi:hypothetical protein
MTPNDRRNLATNRDNAFSAHLGWPEFLPWCVSLDVVPWLGVPWAPAFLGAYFFVGLDIPA